MRLSPGTPKMPTLSFMSSYVGFQNSKFSDFISSKSAIKNSVVSSTLPDDYSVKNLRVIFLGVQKGFDRQSKS